MYVNQNRSRRLLKCHRRNNIIVTDKISVDAISTLFKCNYSAPIVLIELSERYYNHMKDNCINISGITITDNILSGTEITHYSEVTYGTGKYHKDESKFKVVLSYQYSQKISIHNDHFQKGRVH